MESDVNFGIFTLIPPILIIIVSVWTRKSFIGLFSGAVIGFIMSAGLGFLTEIINAAIRAGENNVSMYFTLGLFGSFIFLITASRGTFGFSDLILKLSKTQKKSLIVSWVLGILIFMDDYLNILTVSSCMQTVLDKQKTPREMLAYVIDSTGAPICVIIPLSTWAVYYGDVFYKEECLEGYFTSGSDAYLTLLPFIFYGFTALVVVPLVCLRIIPIFGPMKKAYQRVEETGMVYSEYSKPLNKELEESIKKNENMPKGNLLDFVLPMAIIVVVALYTGDMLTGLVWGIIASGFMYIPRKVIGFKAFFDKVIDGFASMIPMIAICLASQMVRYSMDSIGLPAYVVNATLPLVIPETLPAVAFIIVAGLTFVCSSTWGIPVVCTPIIVPLAIMTGAHVPLTLGAIVSGAAFGSNACFYSDATVLSSQATGIDSMEHALTQIPYALIAAGLAVVLFLIFGFVLI